MIWNLYDNGSTRLGLALGLITFASTKIDENGVKDFLYHLDVGQMIITTSWVGRVF